MIKTQTNTPLVDSSNPCMAFLKIFIKSFTGILKYSHVLFVNICVFVNEDLILDS